MIAFLIALAVLIGGYFLYGLFIEKILGTDPTAEMPAYAKRDNVDYMPLPTWRVFMIQFLNIAGLGPIFGAIMGIMFGPAAFLWIVFGTIFAGAVHDFVSGYVSIRAGGASLPEIVGHELGNGVKQVMRVFSILLLVLVGTVFVVQPANLMSTLTPDALDKTFWVIVIFVYYLLATMLPIDKIIGKFYPVFGGALLFMALGLLGVLLFGDVVIPDGFIDGLHNRYPAESASSHPIFPMMFVSIACGAISGFHATQSPMMARCLTNEKLARPIFYGAMVAEGVVALIWAAAAIAFTNGYEGLAMKSAEHGSALASVLVNEISITWLGSVGGVMAILGVVVAPITTGDTALRSARLIAADFLKFDQSKILKRLLLSIPLFVACFLVMQMDFSILWRYFAWCNQTLAVFTLWAVTVYLARKKKLYVVTLLPAIFMTIVTITYLLFAPRPEGLGLDLSIAVGVACLVATLFSALFFNYLNRFNKGKLTREYDY